MSYSPDGRTARAGAGNKIMFASSDEMLDGEMRSLRHKLKGVNELPLVRVI